MTSLLTRLAVALACTFAASMLSVGSAAASPNPLPEPRRTCIEDGAGGGQQCFYVEEGPNGQKNVTTNKPEQPGRPTPSPSRTCVADGGGGASEYCFYVTEKANGNQQFTSSKPTCVTGVTATRSTTCVAAEVERGETIDDCQNDGFICNRVIKPVVEWMTQSISRMMTGAAGLWLRGGSETPDSLGGPGGDGVSVFIQKTLFFVTAAVAVGGLIWQAMLLMLVRRAEPAVTIVKGLLTVAIWSALAIRLPSEAMRLTDSLSQYMITQMKNYTPGANGLEPIGAAVNGATGAIGSTALAILLFIPLVIAWLVVALVLAFRETAVAILAGCLVLAAAGSFTASTRHWLPKLIAWILALIAYQPAAVMVFVVSSYMYNDSQSFYQLGKAVMFLFMAIFALPVLMKFFTWGTGQATGNAMAASTSASSTYLLYGKGGS